MSLRDRNPSVLVTQLVKSRFINPLHGTLNPVEIALGAGARFSFSDRPFDVSLPLVSEFALNHAEIFSIEFYFLTIY